MSTAAIDIDYATGEVIEPRAAETQALAPVNRFMTTQHLMPVMTVEQAVERYRMLGEFISQVMKKDEDFGIIPGTEKPVLYKPGAEKLVTLFGMTPKSVLVASVEDWNGEDHGGESLFYY